MNAWRIIGIGYMGVKVDQLDLESETAEEAELKASVVMNIKLHKVPYCIQLSKDTVKCIDGGRVKK